MIFKSGSKFFVIVLKIMSSNLLTRQLLLSLSKKTCGKTSLQNIQKINSVLFNKLPSRNQHTSSICSSQKDNQNKVSVIPGSGLCSLASCLQVFVLFCDHKYFPRFSLKI